MEPSLPWALLFVPKLAYVKLVRRSDLSHTGWRCSSGTVRPCWACAVETEIALIRVTSVCGGRTIVQVIFGWDALLLGVVCAGTFCAVMSAVNLSPLLTAMCSIAVFVSLFLPASAAGISSQLSMKLPASTKWSVRGGSEVGLASAGSNMPRFNLSKLEFASSWIGKAHGAMVFFARSPHSSEPIRVKILPRDILQSDVALALESLVLLTKKVRQSSHAVHTRFIAESDHLSFCGLEFVGSDLQSFLIDNGGRLTEKLTSRFVHKLLQALQDLHFYNIGCGVLPAESVLLSHTGEVKVDVGYTPCLLGTRELRESTIQSTLLDAADCPPEYFSEGLLSTKADVWAVGLLLYRMLVGHSPFSHSNRSELLAAICDRPVAVPMDVSDEARRLLMCMLDKNPASRASVRYTVLDEL